MSFILGTLGFSMPDFNPKKLVFPTFPALFTTNGEGIYVPAGGAKLPDDALFGGAAGGGKVLGPCAAVANLMTPGVARASDPELRAIGDAAVRDLLADAADRGMDF